MKYIVIKTSPKDISFKNLSGHLLAEGVLMEINSRLRAYYGGKLIGVRGFAENGTALQFSNSSGVYYWIFADVDKNAIDAIIKEGESLIFAEISLSEQRSKQFWRNDFSVEIKNIEFTEIKRIAEESNKYAM
ncbi:TPA: hypothetical protein JA361_13625 [Legionella pneumophila]|nr:hypothetical protein [Legionella pneumophila]HAT8182322.1 hypothetical protein [Legionella pneumophila]